MKVCFEGKDISRAVGKVIRGITNRVSIPVLTGILLEGEGERAVLTSTDLEMGIHVECPARFEEEGRVVLPGKTFASIVRGIHGTGLEMKTLPGHTLEITAGSSFYRLAGFPESDFPLFPAFPEEDRIQMNGLDLKNGIQRTSFAVSRDEMRPQLTGILFEFEKNELNLVATDGHRLSVARLTLEGLNTEDGQAEENPENLQPVKRFLVPVRTALEITRVLSDQEVELYFGEGRIMVRDESVTLFSRLIDGTYPDYHNFFTQDVITRISVSRNDLAGVLERVSVVFTEEFGVVQMTIHESSLEFVGQSSDLGEAREEIAADIEGKRMELAYNVRYLLDAVKVTPWETMEIGVTGELTPTRIGGRKEFNYILMPLRSEEE